MKKVISLVMTLFLTISMFSCLGVLSYGISGIESISVETPETVELIENVDGKKVWYNGEEFFVYDCDPFIKDTVITVNYADGTAKQYVYNYYTWCSSSWYEDDTYYNNEEYQFINSSDDSDYIYIYIEQAHSVGTRWDVGAHNFTITYNGYSAELPVKIVESPVESIEYSLSAPITYEEYELGERYCSESDSYCKYNKYYGSEYDALTVNYKDGRSVEYTYDDWDCCFYDSEGNSIYTESSDTYDLAYPNRIVKFSSDHSSHNWVGGKDYEMTVSYMGKTTTFPVHVNENLVKSFSYTLKTPVTYFENTNGYWYSDGCISGYEDRYYYYSDYYSRIYNCMEKFTVTYKDGTTEDFVNSDGNFYNADGVSFNFNTDDNQYSNHWVKGGENYFTLKAYGYEVNVPVTILPGITSVEFIPVEPFVFTEHSGGYWSSNGYKYNIDEYINQDGNIFRVNLADGSHKDYVSEYNEYGESVVFRAKDGTSIQENYDLNFDGNVGWTEVDESNINITYYVGGDSWYDNSMFKTETTVSFIGDPAHEEVCKDVAATCTKTGYTLVSCDGCGEENRTNRSYAFGHDYEGGFCVICGANQAEDGKAFLDKKYECESNTEFEFTAPYSGYYKFASYDEGDPYIELLYNEEYYYGDDTYESYNFELFVYMYEGESATFGVYNNWYCNNITFDITFVGEEIPLGVGDYIYTDDLVAKVISEDSCMITSIETDSAEVTVPAELEGYKVETIAGYVWGAETQVLNLPATITELSQFKFVDWYNLKEINIAEGSKEYKSQNGIVYSADLNEIIVIPNAFSGEIIIPLGTTDLTDDMLKAMKNASKVSVAAGHTAFVEEDGIIYNKDFTKIYFAKTLPAKYVMKNTVKELAPRAFEGIDTVETAEIAPNVTNIAYAAFADCSALKSVDLPDKLVSIGTAAFGDDVLLDEIELPSTVESIDDRSFYNCAKLNEVAFNDGLTYIGGEAFSYTAIEKVDLPDSLVRMGGEAFAHCEKLTSADIGKGLKAINYSTFNSCKALKQFEIPANITEIGYAAFAGSGLTSVDVPGTVKEVYGYAFGDCKDLVCVNVENGVEFIDAEAFYSCTALKAITIYDSVDYIGTRAAGYFYNEDTEEDEKIAGFVVFGKAGSAAEKYAKENGFKFTAVEDKCKHPSTKWITDKAATCTAEGTKHKECTDCKEVIETQTIAKKAHTTSSWVIEKAATCTEKGSKYRECTECKAVIETAEIAANGHIAGDWKTTKAATCTADGAKQKTCTVCKIVVEKQTITKTGHKEVKDAAVAATCTKAGKTEGSHCSVCKAVIKAQKTVEATGHKIGGWIIDKEATCTKDGRKHKACTVCGAVTPDTVIPKTGHKEVKDAAVAATCTKAGKTEGSHCSVCKAVIKAQKTVEATGHKIGDWIIDKEPTCTKEGRKHKACTVCGAVTPDTAIAKTEHTMSDWIVDKEATCVADGVKHKECTVCKAVSADVAIPKTGHKSSDWITDKKASAKSAGQKHKECTECGEVLETAKIPQLKCSKPVLKAVSNTASGVKITWKKTSGADSYRVYRKTSKGKWKCIATTTKDYYTDKKAKSGTKYYYAIKATNEAGNSSLSKSLSKYYLADPTLKTPKSTKSGVTLEWNKITGAEGYVIYRKTGSGDYKKIATVKGNKKVKYTNKSAKKGKTYTYKIKAYKSKTYSAYSNAKKIKDKY